MEHPITIVVIVFLFELIEMALIGLFIEKPDSHLTHEAIH